MNALIAWLALSLSSPAPSSPLTSAQEVSVFESFRRAASLRLEPLLIHVFGDPAVLAGLDTLGGRTELDCDGDGRVDALAWREGENTVAAMDEDGDLGQPVSGDASLVEADRDSDVYLADLGSDGTLDRVVDYVDADGDGDPDRVDLFELSPGSLGVDGIGVTVFLDLDDDDKMLEVTDYGYHANRNMWSSDFEGDGCFIAGSYDEARATWISSMENPFCFYDWNADGLTDEALRLEGRDTTILSMRWSIDADGDASGTNPRDFDCSITAVGRIRSPEALRDSVLLRDGRHMRFVGWRHARDLAAWGLWSRILLVWDEDDRNVAPFSEVPDRERWEGVIADRFRGFPQVGGPASGFRNKRYEIDDDGSGRAALYFSEIDRRIHLVGAEAGELQIAGGSGTLALLTTDTDGNGFFDTWAYSGPDGSDPAGIPMHRFPSESVRSLPPFGPELRSFWKTELGGETEKVRFGRRADRIRAGKDLERPRRPGARRRHLLGCRPDAGQTVLVQLPPHEVAGGEPIVLVGPSTRALGQVVKEGSSALSWFHVGQGSGGASRHAGPLAIEIGPDRATVSSELVRVDPWFKSGIAFETLEHAYRTYDGRLDFFAKKRPSRFILRTDLGDIHVPQPWGMDPFLVGSGPGLGGAYFFHQQEWVPLFGREVVVSQRVLEEGPTRCEIEAVLRSTEVEVVRRWSLTGESGVVTESLALRRAPSERAEIALALHEMETSGVRTEDRGIWSFGHSATGAPPVGVAGASLDDHPFSAVRLHGALAIGYRIAAGDTIHIGWLAGTDTSAAAWSDRAFEEIKRMRRGPLRCSILRDRRRSRSAR